MKQILSKRHKKPYSIALAVSLAAIFMSAAYLNVPNFKILGIIFIAILSLASVVWLYLVLDTHGVVEKEGDTLTIRRGLWKTEVKISDVKEITKLPHPTKVGEYQNNCLSIKATVNGEEKNLVCTDAEDVNAVITWFYRIHNA